MDSQIQCLENFFTLRFGTLFVPDPCDFQVSKIQKSFTVQRTIRYYPASQNALSFCTHRCSVTKFGLVFPYQWNSPRYFSLQTNNLVFSNFPPFVGTTELGERKEGRIHLFLTPEGIIFFLVQTKKFQVSKWEDVNRLLISSQCSLCLYILGGG